MNVNSSAAFLTNCSDGAPSGNVLNLTYGFNWGSSDNGNIVSFASSGQQNFNRSYTSYDALNRLKAMSAPGDVCSGLSWTYDAWGNRKTQTVTGGSCFSPQLSFSTKNRLSGSPYVYDAAGNLTNDGFHSYTYDAESRITKVDGGTTASYTYDALGRRVEKIVNNGPPTEFVYDAEGNIFWLVEGAGAHLGHYYVHMNGQLLAEYFEGTTYFAHQDHLGSTRLLTRMDRTVRECDDYYPFGESIPCGDTTGTPHKFTGKERDAESGLDNFGARYDASSLGRFMTPDWAAKPTTVPYAVFGDPQSLNLYAYVRNDPVARADADGHTDQCTNDTGYSGSANVRCAAKNTVNVYSYQNKVTNNADGTSTVVQTKTTATFSAAKGMEGKFLGATTQTATFGVDPDIGVTNYHASDPKKITYGQAVGVIGADKMAEGVAAALPSFATQFGRVTAQDARAHPGKYAFAGVEILAIFTPLPEALAAVEGMHEVKAMVDTSVAAGDLSLELVRMATGN